MDSSKIISNDTTFSSPESAFYDYQIKMENQLCQVCHSLAAGFHHGAYVCEACKKFFKRYSTNQLKTNIICKLNCDLEKIGRRKCSFCRYKKCLSVGMKYFGIRSIESNVDISKIPCRVCGGKSSGFHFGSLTCEGCKGFFRRAEPMKDKLECLSGKFDCTIASSNKILCKLCRFRRCVAVGMSKRGSRIGRQPNAVKHHCALEITNFQNIHSSSMLTDNGFHEFESCNSDSINDCNNESPLTSIPATPINTDLAMTFSLLKDDQTKHFFIKAIEAIEILQTPIAEAENLFQVSRCPVHRTQTLSEVWESMMKHFDVHTYVLVYFAKKIPGFNSLSLSDKRTMVQDAMYSIMLLNLSKSYRNENGECFNYFDFSKEEYDVILWHLPEMKKILEHVIETSRVVHKLKISKIQVGLLCMIELCKNYQNLESSNTVRTIHTQVVRIFWLSILNELDNVSSNPPSNSFLSVIHDLLHKLHCPEDLIVHISSKIPLHRENEWCEKLHMIFKYLGERLQEFNFEHQSIIDGLKKTRPDLPYPELYTEMFQLANF